MNLYGHQLRQIADIIDKLDEVSKGDIFLGQNLPVIDGDNIQYGALFDEIGGSYSFTPAAR